MFVKSDSIMLHKIKSAKFSHVLLYCNTGCHAGSVPGLLMCDRHIRLY